MSDDLVYTPATDIAALIARRQISPVELTETLLDRIAALEPRLNAFVSVTGERARDDAKRAERAVMRGDRLGPLHGVPLTIKDFIDTAGIKTTFGSHLRADNVPISDSVVAARLREAGAVLLGKTTGSDLGWIATGDSPLTGSTANPWRPDTTPGGSSAGACAAVAAGLGPLAVGTDGAGSVRVPASFCGVFGLKPSYGRIPFQGQSPLSNGHHGPIARTVADAALMLRVMAGPHDADPASLRETLAGYEALLDGGAAVKRMAWSPNLGFAERVDPAVLRLTTDAIRVFEQAGAMVEEATPDWGDLMSIIIDVWPALWAGRIGDRLDAFRDLLDPHLVACAEEGLRQAPEVLPRALSRRIAFCEQAWSFFEYYDFLLTPTVAVPPFAAKRIAPDGFPQRTSWDWFSWCPFSFPFNFSWHPAASVPVGFTPDGLPVGLQIVGRRFDDLGVLRMAAALEAAMPWTDRRPPVD